MRTGWIVAVLAMALSAGPGQAREFTSSDIYPANTPTGGALAYMSAQMERQSNGRLKLAMSMDRSPDSENFTVAQVRTGKLDMARVSLPVLNATAPLTAVLSAPFVFGSSEAMRRTLDGPIGAEILAELEQIGLVGLCFYDLGSRSLYTTNKPVRSIADVKGLRLRSQPGDVSAAFWQTLGVNPVAMPYGRIADGLRTKVIDGATGNWLSFVAGGHYRAVKYFTPTQHARPPGIVIFSRETWRQLNEEDRKIILASARESAIHEQKLMDAYAVQARRTVEASGVTIVDDFDMKSFTNLKDVIYDSLLPLPRQQDLFLRLQAAAGGV